MSNNANQLSSLLTQYDWKSFIPATDQYPSGSLSAQFNPNGNLSLNAGGNRMGTQWVVTDDGKLQTQNLFSTKMLPPRHIAQRERLLSIVFSPDEAIPIEILHQTCPNIATSSSSSSSDQGGDDDDDDNNNTESTTILTDPSVILRIKDLTFCAIAKDNTNSQ